MSFDPGVSAADRRPAPKSILVVKPSSFGDIVHALPAVARIRAAWPGARLTWVVNREWLPLLDGNRDVDDGLVFPRQEFRGWDGWRRFLGWCKAELAPIKPELAIDFQGLFRSAWIGRASGAKHLVGLSDAREGATWFYDQVVRLPSRSLHAVERYVAGANATVQIFDPERHSIAAKDLPCWLPEGQPVPLPGNILEQGYILLHPFARGAGKSLTAEEITELCQFMSPRRIVLVGQLPVTRWSGLPANCLDLSNQTTLAQLIWLIRQAAFVVTVDSGPAHLAAALKKPMVAIHTWSDPRLVGPFWEDATIWKNGVLLQVKELPGSNLGPHRGRPAKLRAEDLAQIAGAATSS